MIADLTLWTVATIVAALLVASGLLVRRDIARPRLAALLALQWLAGTALLLTLFPPAIRIGGASAAVATGPLATLPEGEVFALPEAGTVPGATPVPDLSAAIARLPAATPIDILGPGLVERDRIETAAPLRFTPPPQPAGIVAIALPQVSAPGTSFSFGGETSGLAGGRVDLLDPSGAAVADAALGDDGRFVLSASSPAPGTALFTLIVRERTGKAVERLTIPVETRENAAPRLLVLAGAPSAEIRQLRRFAEDAGIDVTVRIDLGAGLQTGDAPVAIAASALSRTDLLVIDDRRWERLSGGERAAITSALSGGMGLLLRPTGPLSASTRREWAALGLNVSGGDANLPVRLNDAPDALPLARRDIVVGGANASTMLPDVAGNPLGAWAPNGRGRIGSLALVDSYALTLTGDAERYSALWSTIFSTLAREGEVAPPRLERLVRSGGRGAICGLDGDARLLAPGGGSVRLLVDRAAGPRGCAAFWPQASGWHVVRGTDDVESAVYVHPADAAPALAAAERRRATLAMTGRAGNGAADRPAPGSRWPWFLSLMLSFGGLWWLERRGRAVTD